MIDPRGLSATRLALLGRELWAERGKVQAAEPLAVVGYACRVPGANDPEAFWELLLEGRDEVGQVPEDRWDADQWFDSDPATPGRMSSRWGGFIDQVRGFDATFFGISASEAERMDPQQRLALEVTWEAIERSGIPTDRLAGSATGVYFAAYHDDYARMQYSRPESITARTLTGTLHSVLANRISFLLGLHGPSLAVDTACSSSLVAVHLARRALLDRDCDLAIAGGVSLMLEPPVTVALSKGGFMSPTGRCHTFDADADGFVRGEGCGVLVLRRLSDAIERGERVLAVVRGSAVNQDGVSSTLSAPNGTAQAALIRHALDGAGLDPSGVSLLEAHGTGTRLGDPIETDALAEVFGGVERSDPLWLGSVKANLGHLEAAAGVTGLIKAILCLRHQTVPPQPLFREQNPLVDLSGTPLRVPEAVEHWSPPGPRIAGVSSFGVGGTNGHVLLEETPAALSPASEAEVARPLVLPLSAPSAGALDALVERVAERLDQGVPAARLCRAAARGRTHHRRYRRAFSAADPEALRAALDGGMEPPEEGGDPPALAFVYSGQGTQWSRMGLDLAAGEPVFRDALGRVHESVLNLGGPNLIEEIERPDDQTRLHRTDVAQVGIFAVQVALTELLRSWGVRPDAVVGHSVGEVAAAWSTGHLDFDAAVAAVVARATVMQERAGPGAMLWLGTDSDRASLLAERHGLVVAARNGPGSTVLSGDATAIAEAADMAVKAGMRHGRLGVEYAFHSPAMEEAAEVLRQGSPPVVPGSGTGRWYSSVHAAPVAALDAGWLADNVRSTVRFADAVAAVASDGVRHFVELGPHPALGSDIVSTLAGEGLEGRIACAMHRRRAPLVQPRALLAKLYMWGADPAWDAVSPGVVDVEGLPTYPWQRTDYWLPDEEAVATGVSDPRGGRFPGVPLDSPAVDGWAWELDPGHPALRALLDHRIDGVPRMPATAIAELCRAAGEGAGLEDPVVAEIIVLAPVSLQAGAGIQTLVSADRTECRVVQKDETGRWLTVARADLEAGSGAEPLHWGSTESSDGDSWTGAQVVALHGSAGTDFGAAYTRLGDLRVGAGWAVGQVAAGAGWPGPIDPAAVDAAAQLCVAVLADREGLFLPFSLGRYRVHAPTPSGPLQARVRTADRATADTPGFDIRLEDPDGRVLVEILGWRMRQHRSPSTVFAPEWRREPLDPDGPSAVQGSWLVVGEGELTDIVATLLAERGADRVSRHLDQADPELSGVLLCAGLDGPDGADAEISAPDADRHWSWAEVVRRCAADPSGSLQTLVVTRGAQEPPPVGRGSDPAGGVAVGLARALRSERPDLRVRTVDLDPSPRAVDPAEVARQLLAELEAGRPGDGIEVALRLEGRWVSQPGQLRSVRPAARPESPVHLHHATSGRLDRFEVVDGPDLPEPSAGQVVVRVEAAGVNFRDVLSALGMVDGSPDSGQECAGRVVAVGPDVRGVSEGDRVVAFHPGSFGSHLVLSERAVWSLPDGVDPVGGATLPITFGTAWVALYELGGLQSDASVLIHGGAGGVGMAAVRLALGRGARVFATAGSPARRARLEAIGVAGAFDSRSTDFEADVAAATGGEGVDLVINSLTGEAIAAGLRCLRSGGRFIELGKRELLDDEAVRAVRSDVGYQAFDLRTMVDADPALSRRLGDALAEGFADGSLRPLPAAIFDLAEAGTAYRRMSRGDHLGKLVLRPTHPPAAVGGEGWAVVAGGSGAIGQSTVRWLLAEGRRHIAVLSRGGLPSDDPLHAVATAAGAELRSLAVDLADAGALDAALAEFRETGPVTFVVHSAGAVHDGVLSGLARADFEAVAAPKVRGAWNLHDATRDDPVEAFILYSAAGPWLDASGLAAYAAANGYIEALALHRRGLGLPATAVVWGPWDGGMAGRLDERHRERWVERGALTWDEEGGWSVLADTLRSDAPTILAVRGIGAERPARRDPAPAAADMPPLEAALQGAAPGDEQAVAIEHVSRVLERLLGRPSVDPDMPLRDMGLDSLGAIELRNTLTRSSGSPLPATIAFDHPTVRALAMRLIADRGMDDEVDLESAVPSGSDVDMIADLDDDVALNLLLQELDGTG